VWRGSWIVVYPCFAGFDDVHVCSASNPHLASLCFISLFPAFDGMFVSSFAIAKVYNACLTTTGGNAAGEIRLSLHFLCTYCALSFLFCTVVAVAVADS
jgi:hypothetical protein